MRGVYGAHGVCGMRVRCVGCMGACVGRRKTAITHMEIGECEKRSLKSSLPRGPDPRAA